MSDGPLLNDVTRAFAEAHRNEDVRDLALKTKRTADLDLPAALDQIAGWQIARNKLPQWAACADIVYPVSNRALFRDTEDNTGHAPHTA